MNHKKLLSAITLFLSVFFMFAVEFGVNAEDEQAESEIKVEYDNFEDIPRDIQTKSGTTMYLVLAEESDGIWQALYLDESRLQEYQDSEGFPSPHIVVNLEKTVISLYNSFDDIPSSINYEEYNDTYRTWMKGTLQLQSAVRYGNHWEATFKGTITGII